MPKVKWIRQKKVNHLAALLREYKRAAGMSSAEIAEKLGCTADNVRRQIGKPADKWTIGALKRYCEAIGIPLDDALEAAAK